MSYYFDTFKTLRNSKYFIEKFSMIEIHKYLIRHNFLMIDAFLYDATASLLENSCTHACHCSIGQVFKTLSGTFTGLKYCICENVPECC